MNTDKKPDFYLSSTDHKEFNMVRSCWVLGKVECEYIKEHKDGLWVKISPPVIGQKYGLGGKDIEELIIYPRFKGASLFPINEDPLDVKVFRVLDPKILQTKKIKDKASIDYWAWAEISKQVPQPDK